jgi:carbon-monoxide dehydrogenase small subunit
MTYLLTVNGRRIEVDPDPMASLAGVLRDDIALTGTKIGCAEGRCGSCTVLVDGLAVASCLYPVALADGAEITTVEGLADGDTLSALQEEILETGGVQCGACTPGVLITLTATLAATPDADEGTIRRALAGNICRCTGYQQIVDAALAVAGRSAAA